MPHKLGRCEINFAGRKETAQEVFGEEPILASKLIQVLWRYIKKNGLDGSPVILSNKEKTEFFIDTWRRM